MAMGEKRNGTGSGFFRSARRVLVRSSGERVSAAGPGLPFGGSSPTYNRAGRIVRPRFLLGLCPGILLSFGEKNKVKAPEARVSLPGEGGRRITAVAGLARRTDTDGGDADLARRHPATCFRSSFVTMCGGQIPAAFPLLAPCSPRSRRRRSGRAAWTGGRGPTRLPCL